MLTGDRLMTHPSMQEFEQKLLQQEKFSPVEIAAYERLLTLFNPLDASFTPYFEEGCFPTKDYAGGNKDSGCVNDRRAISL